METDDRNRDIEERLMDMFEKREYLKKYYGFLFFSAVVFMLSFLAMLLFKEVFVIALICQVVAFIGIILAVIGIIRNS